MPHPHRPGSLDALLLCFLEWLEVHNYATTTVQDRRATIGMFIKWAKLRGLDTPQEITKPILERYQRHLFYYRKPDGDPLSFRTQGARLVPVRAFFKWLARENHILYNPASELELPRPEKRLPKAILSPEEAEAVMIQPDIETPTGLRDRAILELFYATAIRRLELANLKLWDADISRGALSIHQGKGGRDRIVPLGERASAWLIKYRDDARPQLVTGRDEGWLFLTRQGIQIEARRLSERVSAYIKASGTVKTGSCHLFRHTAATLMLENGADIRFIQALLGHESLETTQIYTKVSIVKLAEIHAATHPGARLGKQEEKNGALESPA